MTERGPLCERCQGNGEIVLDWATYLHPQNIEAEERSVAECPDCYGYGRLALSSQDRA